MMFREVQIKHIYFAFQNILILSLLPVKKQTSFERLIISSGGEIITWEHDIIAEYLLQIFNRDYDSLLLMAASDNQGMTIREYAAIQILAGMMSGIVLDKWREQRFGNGKIFRKRRRTIKLTNHAI